MLVSHLLPLLALVQAEYITPVAKVSYSRSDSTYFLELQVGSPAQSLIAHPDTTARDIVLSTNYDSSSSDFEGSKFNYDSSLSSTWNAYSSPWGSDTISFDGSGVKYTSVLFAERDSEYVPSILGLGAPNTYATGLKSLWGDLATLGVSPGYAFGFESASQDPVGSYDSSTQSGWISFGGVARAFYDSLSTVPLLQNDSALFTFSGLAVALDDTMPAVTVSDTKLKAVIETLPQYPTMPRSLTEKLASTIGSELETNGSGMYNVDCDSLAELLLDFQGQSIRIPAAEVVSENDDGTCSLVIIPSDSVLDTVTLAGGLLSYIYFVVDYANSQLSLGQAILPGEGTEPEFVSIKDSIPGASLAPRYDDVWTHQQDDIVSSSNESSAASATVSGFSNSSFSATFSTSSTSLVSSLITAAPSSSAASASLTTVQATSNAADEPYLIGDFASGKLRWLVGIPASLGPWTSVQIDASGTGYNLNKVASSGVDVTSYASISGGTLEYTTEEPAISDWLEIVYSGGRLTIDTKLTSTIVLTINRADKKRDVLLFQLSATIDTTDPVTLSVFPVTSTVTKSTRATVQATVTSCTGGCVKSPTQDVVIPSITEMSSEPEIPVEYVTLTLTKTDTHLLSSLLTSVTGSTSSSSAQLNVFQATSRSTTIPVTPSALTFSGAAFRSYAPGSFLLIPLALFV